MDADKSLAAACGLFCPSCTFYIGSTEDPRRLQALAERFKRTVDDLTCFGCRSDKRSIFCENYCKMTKCAAQKGIDFCGQCPEYPCADLKAFQSLMPHRIELWDSHQRINDAGWETWFLEMVEHYSCPRCHTVNSAYDIACRKCGTEPGNEYVEQHETEIVKVLGKMGPPPQNT
jgi:hypothetical protein